MFRGAHLAVAALVAAGALLTAPPAQARPVGVGVHVGYGYYHPGFYHYGYYHPYRFYSNYYGLPWYYGTFYSNPAYYANYYVGPTYVPYVPPLTAYVPSRAVYQSYYAPSSYYPYYAPGTSGYVPSAPYVPTPSAAPAQDPNSVLLDVRLPQANARVTIDGSPTTQQGTNRQFVSPPLEPGKKYSYDIEAKWTEDGKEVSQSRKVIVEAGKRIDVDFTKPAP